jgi:protein-disulfide isomerase
MRRVGSIILTTVAFAWAAPTVVDDAVTCKQTDEILSELRQIRKLLERMPSITAQPRTATAAIDVGNAPFLGSKEAPLTIVEFTDYECPYCRQFHQQTFQDLKKHYIDSGRVRFYSMDLPLDIHRNALLAAHAGRCAHEQGQFWRMHDQMQANPEHLEAAKLVGYAGEIGMDSLAFRRCLDSGKYNEAIQQATREAMSKGARGTPTFVIGRSTPSGVEGELIVGAVPFGIFEIKLKELSK